MNPHRCWQPQNSPKHRHFIHVHKFKNNNILTAELPVNLLPILGKLFDTYRWSNSELNSETWNGSHLYRHILTIWFCGSYFFFIYRPVKSSSVNGTEFKRLGKYISFLNSSLNISNVDIHTLKSLASAIVR